MRRTKGLTALGAILLCAAVALAACGGSKSMSPSSATAPVCLPRSLQHDASLPGGVSVSPAPGSVTANPDTQISFLGIPASSIGDVSVKGSSSDAHTGHLDSF